jgi:RHH-type proline utilization regulon transcriptional repressor/proline dehydrogenase/delta 1-pyrroline-5-carboxylate dehydrogenase
MDLSDLRHRIRDAQSVSEEDTLQRLVAAAGIDDDLRQRAHVRGAELVTSVRESSRPALMEAFLAEYGLSTDEGVALMCLAEALLRVPDPDTIDALIEDKIAPSEWGQHLGKSNSTFVNASTWALMLTGRVLDEGGGIAAQLRGLVKRLGEPVIRVAVARAMRELGAQFVLGETIDDALSRGADQVADGYRYSFDMLGEAALTASDADKYFDAYAHAIDRIGRTAQSSDIRDTPGISVKLSALHPRYETLQSARVMDELVPRLRDLARRAARSNMGLNIDAEEAERLDVSLDVIGAVLADTRLAGWDGFGVVVQAYGKRASPVIDWLAALASDLDRKLMVRLVKGAYWDREIKRAQVEGLNDFPVFTKKAHTDVSYLACARKLLGLTDRIYPQFATHNAHTIATILELAGQDKDRFEFQRLHGMGESLHAQVAETEGTRCRIYAPVGTHRDLLAYLVRRLLENGANSSFVNQIVDTSIPAATVAADPFDDIGGGRPAAVRAPKDLYKPFRPNSRGWDVFEPAELSDIDALRTPYKSAVWSATSRIAGEGTGGQAIEIRNPANPDDLVGTVCEANRATIETALDNASPWAATATERAETLRRAARALEAKTGEITALLAREAGKTLVDAIAELREAVDFLNYYSTFTDIDAPPRGIFTCISPWNFPLAIFTGQIAAALAAGNGVIAKPAETTPLIADLAVRTFHEAGVPASALQLVLGTGRDAGALITADPRISGVCFTGSTATAQTINRSMARHLSPRAPLIAETGGINAMIVDSTALPEQAIRDIVTSAFRSAGQRCSALRVLYLQEDIAPRFTDMLFGAMDELSIGDPWQVETDVGPAITDTACGEINGYISDARSRGTLLKTMPAPQDGTFVSPSVIKVAGIANVQREIFGPVLHLATFAARDLDRVIDEINDTGFGLTFGLHTRIDGRVEYVTKRLKAGNLYVNRNQIGAVVGTQPFGGEGLSGTGPKAGGPSYVKRFTQPPARISEPTSGSAVDIAAVQSTIASLRRPSEPLGTMTLPGPTGETNRLSEFGRGLVLCLGPTAEDAKAQAEAAIANGCTAIQIAPGASDFDGHLPGDALRTVDGIDAVASFADEASLRDIRIALSDRAGKILPCLSESDLGHWCRIERHLCVDTTAAGGNASLLAASER